MFVDRFMAWSVSAGVDQRISAVRQLAEKYVDQKIIAEDKAAAEQVFTLYLKDPDCRVRTAMANALASYDSVPLPLLWALAEDMPQVSAEIFRNSSQLRKKDLLHAVQTADELVQIAIAERQDVDASVVRHVAEVGCNRAVCALLDNSAVILSPTLKHDIANRLSDDADIRAQLLADDDITSATRQLLTSSLSSALLSFADSKGWGVTKRLQETANDASNRVAVEIADNSSAEDMQAYAEHMYETGQLTPAFLIRAICAGNAYLFEAAVSQLSGTSLKRVQGILDERRLGAFKALYRKTGLPQSALPVFTAAVSIWQASETNADAILQIIDRVEHDEHVDGALLALLGRIAVEENQVCAQKYEKQLLLAA